MRGCADEVWWRRVAQPDLHGWAPDDAGLRRGENAVAQTDPDPKALAWYGLLLRPTRTTPEQIWLRFATGEPVSGSTPQVLAWCCAKLTALGKRALLLVWDNASWHKRQLVRLWIRDHHRHVKATGTGVRIVPCLLPSKSPWLNPIAPKWVHGKRAVVEPDRVLTAPALEARVDA